MDSVNKYLFWIYSPPNNHYCKQIHQKLSYPALCYTTYHTSDKANLSYSNIPHNTIKYLPIHTVIRQTRLLIPWATWTCWVVHTTAWGRFYLARHRRDICSRCTDSDQRSISYSLLYQALWHWSHTSWRRMIQPINEPYIE